MSNTRFNEKPKRFNIWLTAESQLILAEKCEAEKTSQKKFNLSEYVQELIKRDKPL
jgi:hypothetical protein